MCSVGRRILRELMLLGKLLVDAATLRKAIAKICTMWPPEMLKSPRVFHELMGKGTPFFNSSPSYMAGDVLQCSD